MAKKIKTTKESKGKGEDNSLAIGAVAEALSNAASALGPLYKIEETNDALSGIASALYEQASISRMGIIAQYGTEEDREIALKYLKDHFGGYFKSK
jgi:hypothetical protein